MQTTNEIAIRDRLVERGQALFNAPHKHQEFTKTAAADALLNDLAGHPHAFVLACLMDRQIKAEKAWLIPYEISLLIGGFSMETLRKLSLADVTRHMSHPKPLHRYADMMSGVFYSGIQRIGIQYGNDAARIWAGNPSSAEVVYRFLEFDGAGQKIATMAANILARDFKVPFADYSAIDVSADVHIRRVFGRLGLCPPDANTEQVVYKAKALYPKFPGLMDLPCWEIGRTWCKASGQECAPCYMKDLCPAARAGI
jgi:hypothetical protein